MIHHISISSWSIRREINQVSGTKIVYNHLIWSSIIIFCNTLLSRQHNRLILIFGYVVLNIIHWILKRLQIKFKKKKKKNVSFLSGQSPYLPPLSGQTTSLCNVWYKLLYLESLGRFIDDPRLDVTHLNRLSESNCAAHHSFMVSGVLYT